MKLDISMGTIVSPDVYKRQVETIPLGAGLPVAVRTRFGFVIMGRAPISLNCALTCASGLTGLPLDLVSAHQLHCHFHHFYPSVTTLSTDTTNLIEQVHRFWEVEEPPAVPHQLSEEDHFAERFYICLLYTSIFI